MSDHLLSPRCHVLVPCAGTGTRAGAPVPKQYQTVAGLPLVLHTLAAFQAVHRVSTMAVVVAPSDDFFNAYPDIDVMRCGGASRAHTVFNGLQALRERGGLDHDWVLVHDAARCLVTAAHIEALIAACQDDPVGGLLALKLPDTLKTESKGRVTATVDRSDKWLAHTPQMFRLGMLHSALSTQAAKHFQGVTDEASAIEALGHQPLLVPSSAQNFKVTYAEDFALAHAILQGRR